MTLPTEAEVARRAAPALRRLLALHGPAAVRDASGLLARRPGASRRAAAESEHFIPEGAPLRQRSGLGVRPTTDTTPAATGAVPNTSTGVPTGAARRAG